MHQESALPGIGPSGAARLLVEVGDITRFPNKAHFASWNGTAPIDASSGDQVRHRLSRGGNRQINRVLHIMARVQIRNPSEGRDYYERKKADGKAPMEAMRCVKRRLSDIVYQQMLTDALAHAGTGPGGQKGNDSDSSDRLTSQRRLFGQATSRTRHGGPRRTRRDARTVGHGRSGPCLRREFLRLAYGNTSTAGLMMARQA